MDKKIIESLKKYMTENYVIPLTKNDESITFIKPDVDKDFLNSLFTEEILYTIYSKVMEKYADKVADKMVNNILACAEINNRKATEQELF